MESYVLVLNAGSSSLKFAGYVPGNGRDWTLLFRGQIEGIGTAPRLWVRDERGHALQGFTLASNVADVGAALQLLAGWLPANFPGVGIRAIGHRVVHGGPNHRGPALVTSHLLEELHTLEPLAPLHQPHNLAAIEAVRRKMPSVPQVACFDTSFHRSHPAVAQLIPLPLDSCGPGVQRYGFHGLSYEYITSVLPSIAPEIADGRVVVAHLGSGASLCALINGRSVDSTFGFTPLDGLCMGTRPGSIDPGVVLHLFQTCGLSAAEVENLLYRRSGLLAISGISNDMRDLIESPDPHARLAVEYFVYRARQEIASMAAVLGGLDALVFTAGIGEHSAVIRQRICEGCRWLGIQLDDAANARHGPRISRADTHPCAWVIPTDEELLIVRQTDIVLMLTDSDAA